MKNFFIKVFLVCVLFSTFLSATTEGEYKRFASDLIKEFRKLEHAIKASSTAVENTYHVAAYTKNMKYLLKNFHNNHHNINPKVKNKINNYYSDLFGLEEINNDLSSKFSALAKPTYDLGENLKNDDVLGSIFESVVIIGNTDKINFLKRKRTKAIHQSERLLGELLQTIIQILKQHNINR